MDAMEQHRWTQFLAAVRREIPSWETAATDAQSEIVRLRAELGIEKINRKEEVSRLTAALSEAQRERDALKGEVERLTKALASEEEISRAFSRSARRLEEERDAAVKRAEEAERSADILQNAHRGTLAASVRASQEAEAAKHRLSLAERVVEAAEWLVLNRPAPEAFQLNGWNDLRSAVAEYRKAVGK